MSKSQETFAKKELQKKKIKKRQEKAEKMEDRKANKSSSSLEDMLAYVDENGNISDTPPDPRKMKVYNLEDVQIGVPQHVPMEAGDLIRKGVITFFNDDKGFGFIQDLVSQERVFVHINNLSGPVKEKDKVTYEVEMGPKGASAVNVKVEA